jgi:nitroimidazol reductase NimA-like FMN-containing flavoprotein (pyridoxamine 5'-phosphate oxidase superfamily)
MLIRALSVLKSTKLPSANGVGHLACAKDGQPYGVPLHYAHTGNLSVGAWRTHAGRSFPRS